MSDPMENVVTCEPVEASLCIELNVSCPHCGDYFDLMQHKNLNDEGAMIQAACPEGHWSEEHREFELTTECPECDQEIKIEGIGW